MEVGSLADWVQVAVTAVGMLIAWGQWQKHKKITSAQHLSEVLAAFRDERIRKAFSKYIDRTSNGSNFYAETSGDEPQFADDTCEMEIDNMLLLFEDICHQAHNGIIQKNAFGCFEYQIRTTLCEAQIQNYLSDLAKYCSKNGGGFPFVALLQEGMRIESLSNFYSGVLRILGKA